MKFPHKSIFREVRDGKKGFHLKDGRRRRVDIGFTLIELLAAIAILSILMLILAQIMGLASFSWSIGKQRVDNLTKARALLDLIARDVQDGVFRPDLAAFIDQAGHVASSSSTSYAFYTKRTGGGPRGLSLINYTLNQTATGSSLLRGALPMSWTGATPSFAGNSAASVGLPELANLANLTSSNYSEVATGVVAFKIYFINSSPASTPTTVTYDWNYLPWNYSSSGATPMTVAIGVTVAVLDDRTQQLLTTQNTMATLTGSSAFPMPSPLTGSLKDIWDTNINTPSFYTSGHYPQQLRTGLKIFERIVSLPSFHQ